MKYSNADLLKMYSDMVDARSYEEVTLDKLSEGELDYGAWHMALGQEATQIGCLCALGPNDFYAPTHRCHAIMAVKLDKKKFTAECLCKRDGYARGKGASVHISSIDDGVIPANGILGANMPIAVGYALAMQRLGKDSVVIADTGDSASNEGNFYEAMNMAAIMHAPVVFLIENNGMGSTNPIENATLLEDLSKKAVSANIPGVTVDGNDVVAVREAMEMAIANARKGQPSVVEAKTCRYRCHSEGLTFEPLRSQEKLEDYKRRDPVDAMEKKLREMGILDDEKIAAIKKDAIASAVEAYDWANSCEYPTREDIVDMHLVYKNLEGEL